MNITHLPPEVSQQIVLLTVDDEFQKKFRNDALLDKLEAQKHNPNIEFQELLLSLNKRHMIGGISFKPITLALYGYLYCIKSNVLYDIDKITKEDLDIFFYLLQTREFTYDMKRLLSQSMDYCKKTYGLDFEVMLYVFHKIYQIQWKVMSLFPHTGIDDEPIFNVDRITSIVAKVKQLTSYTTEQLYTEISCSQIYYYFAQFLRLRGTDGIFTRNNQQILDEMDSRMIELVLERLIQKGKIDASKKQEYFDIMKKKQDKIQEN